MKGFCLFVFVLINRKISYLAGFCFAAKCVTECAKNVLVASLSNSVLICSNSLCFTILVRILRKEYLKSQKVADSER